MAPRKKYFLKNPSGIVFEADKATAEGLLATGNFEQVTDKKIIAQVGKGSQSKAAGTNLAPPKRPPSLIEVE